jgi:hypothetical protein
MPPVNSPSNRKGDKVSTMREEFVVIMRSWVKITHLI